MHHPVRVVLYGVEGIGKTTFGASAPKPIFLGAEDGTGQLDVARFPQPETFEEAIEAVRALAAPNDYETLVVDTLDWLEPLVWEHVCRRDKMSDIESYGFGKGYVAALDEWRRFLREVEMVRRVHPLHVVLVAHSWIKTFKNPQGEDFDRYEMKLNLKAGGLVKEWSDVVAFANYETYAKKDEKTRRVRGVATGARFIFTERTAAFDAKNRYSLPAELPLDWEKFYEAVQAGHVAAAPDLRSEIERKAKAIGGEVEVKVLETMRRAGDDTAQLARINNRVNAVLAEKSAEKGS
jgi:hypothetical protein